MVNVKEHIQTIERALRWFEKIYPSDVFDGSSGDKGVIEVIEIKEGLKRLKKDITSCTPWTES